MDQFGFSIPYFLLCVLVMAGVTYLIRMLPLALLRRKIDNPFFQSFLYYVPYAVLGAMTFPAIFSSTSSPISALAGLAAACGLALRGKGLLTVAIAACAIVFAAEWGMRFLGIL